MYDDTEASWKEENLHCGTSRPLPPKPTETTKNVEDEYESYSEESDYGKIDLPDEREEPRAVLEPPSSGRKSATAESLFIAARWETYWKKARTPALVLLVVVYLLVGIILLSQHVAMLSELRKLNVNPIQTNCENSTARFIIEELRSVLLTGLNSLERHIDRASEASERKTEEKISQLEIKFDLQQKVRNACWKCDSLTWEEFQGSCYYFSETENKWGDAKQLCTEAGSHLIIINSREEQDFVIRKIRQTSVWLGLSDADTEGTWCWVDGSLLTQRYWRTDEPNNNHNEDCAVLYKNGKWNDISCEAQVHFVCERPVCVFH